MAAQKRKKNNKNNQKKHGSGWIGAISVITLFILFLLNDLIFKIDGIPTVKDIFKDREYVSSGEVPEETEESKINFAENNIAVHFIDVGQGDCELIMTKNYNILIDSGEAEYYEKVANYLNKLSIIKLDYVIITHPHSDHAGAMGYILEDFEIGEVIMPKIKADLVPTTKTFLRITEAIDSKSIPLTYANPGNIINIDDASIEILAPVSDYDDLNNYSICFKLTHFENTFLFTGDIEKEAESDILENGADVESDVLKVAHHGSTTSSTKKFINAVSPEYAVFEVGEGNSYGHPHKETVKAFEKRGIEMLRTDYYGTIVFWSDGTEIGYTTEKNPD